MMAMKTDTSQTQTRIPSLNRLSTWVYLGLVLFCLATAGAGQYLHSKGLANLRLFGWDGIGLVALGGLGMWLAPHTGFADLLDTRVSRWQRWGRPLLVGLAFASADVGVYKWVIHPGPVTSLTPFMQPFPYSVLLFGSGALYTDCLYRLIPIPVLMWLVGGLLLKNPRNTGLFWVLAGVTSLVEPYQQLITDSPALIVYSFGTGYAMNVLQAVFFRYYGFLAALTIRLGHYALWHVAFGLWVELT